jgi:stress responsive alpha/beta barrel protein
VVIRHVVCLTWKRDVTDAEIEAVRAELVKLPGKIPEIRDYMVGSDLGVGAGNAHFAIVADFDDVDAWRRYQAHPAHEAVLAERIRPILAARAAVQLQFGP